MVKGDRQMNTKPLASYGLYIVISDAGFLHDASRPYLVLFTGRAWKNVKGRYATVEQAKRRARALGQRNEIYARVGADGNRC
jgi:hypothetical protein